MTTGRLADDATAGFDPDFLAEMETPLTAAITGRNREVLALVRHALQAGQACLAFQPVVQADQPDRIAFHEGLIRIRDRNGRVIPARQFMHAVERDQTGRILDCFALDLGLSTLRQNPGLRLAINMSARSIGYRRWNETLRRGLAGDPTLGERLILEITEASAMLMPEIVAAFMHDLQCRGIAFAMDDFGSGFTSFRYLRQFFFDIVKIDGQFIRGIRGSADNQVLAGALVSIARQFDMFTVAESVEAEEDAHLLAEMGVDCLQGHLFGIPMLAPDWRQAAGATA